MKKIIPLILVGVSFVIAYTVAPYMPYLMASHWGVGGQVDGYMLKPFGLYFMPYLSLFLYFLFLGLPYLEVYKKNFKQFENYYDNFMIVIFTFFVYLYTLTILWNLNFRFNMIQFLSPAFAGLFYYAGILTTHARRNWFVGIRTPWTMSSDRIWDKTHLLGGKLFKVTAVICLLGLVWPSLAIYWLLVPVIGTTLAVFVYSYILYLRYNRL